MGIDKQYILEEIRCIAMANSGKPPGEKEFKNETGINKYDWFPDYWVRWGEAQVETGFVRNKFQEAFTREFLIEKFIDLIRKNKQGNKLRFPVEGEVLAKKRNDPDFPHTVVFRKRFGGKIQLAAAILEYCRGRSGFVDVIEACEQTMKATYNRLKRRRSLVLRKCLAACT